MNTEKSVSGIHANASRPHSGHRRPFRLYLAGMTTALGLGLLVWEFVPSIEAITPLSAATKSKSKEKAEQPEKEASGDSESTNKPVKLNYYSASWAKVFQDISESGDLEFIADRMPSGRYSRRDKKEHSRAEAIRIVNKEIQDQGLRLIEKGSFLILIDIPKANYPPTILQKKAPPRRLDEAQEVAEQVEQPKKPKQGRIDNAAYQEATADSSNPSRGATRSVRQASNDELDGSRRPFVDADGVPGAEIATSVSAFSTYRARNLNAIELSKRIYRALKSEAELVDTGRNGLPAFRIVSPEFRSNDPKAAKSGATRTIEFMISIDETRNELLIDGGAKSIDAVIKLLRIIDRPDADETRTQIKPGSKYVCQVADQLPAEIDRIRAAARAKDKEFAKLPVDGKPLGIADQAQRQVPDANDAAAPPQAQQPGLPNRAAGGALGNFKGEVNIEVIDDLNLMIIRGNERDVEQIMDVIKQIERLSEATSPEVRLLHLRNVDSESLAELLSSVYEKLTKFPGKATQPRESVAIIPVAKPNALLIVAPQADLDAIEELANELDKPVDPQTEFEVIQLKSAVASDVEATITDFYKERKALGAKVLVIADSRSNSLIVRARPRDLDEIKELISKMDRDEVGAVNQVRVFLLKNAVASEMAAVINTAIQSVLSPPRATTGGGGGQAGGGGNAGLGGGSIDEQFRAVKSSVLQFMTVEKGTIREVRSGILSDIRVTPDAHANSLIVTASEKSMDLVAALIATLDRPTSTVGVIKVFTLENADAGQMVAQLNALFGNQQQQGGGLANQLRQQLGVALASADDASSGLVPIKFTVDARTNSIIAVGGADALRVVEAILTRLDESNLRARKNQVIRLNNAPATQIATAITQFFQQQRDLTQNDPNLVSNVEQLEREVIVIPDIVSNNLLVSATPRYMPDIERMIKNLDSVPKQVVIQALIVEVQLNNTDEFGIELGMQSPVLFQRSLVGNVVVNPTTNTSANGVQTTTNTILSEDGSPGFNFNNPGLPLGNNILAQAGTVGGQSLTNFGVGRTNSELGYGGLVLSAGSDSVNALLRALASNNKIQILSRPQIRALDNIEAAVFVGRTIPTVTAFITNANTGVISPTLQQRDTGIGMTVTPRINQDGNIVINLYAYRSQLSKETINVTTDSRGQPVGQRITDLSNVRTTVLVPSNHTIVIGGMISSRDETQSRKAPVLGDLPVIGNFFRFDSRSTIRTELLIFLTPRIVEGQDEEECLKEIEMGRLHFMESEAEDMHGPLRAIPAEDVFSDDGLQWIDSQDLPTTVIPSMPPTTAPTPVIVPPAPTSRPSPTEPMMPSPTPREKPVIPNDMPPPPPDPELSKLKKRRTQATEREDEKSDGITQASYTTDAAPKTWITKPKKLAEPKKSSKGIFPGFRSSKNVNSDGESDDSSR